MVEAGIDPAPLDAEAESLRQDGATVIFVAVAGRPAGVIAIADPIKASTPAAVAALKQAGIRLVMLTGDNATTARAVARKLGIDEVEAEVLPQDKSKVVERLRREGRVVAMAGDGVNDAPALAAADIGVAMGTGTDVAMQNAGVTLVRATSWGWFARGACRPRPWPTSARTCSSPSFTMRRACRSRPACSIRLRACCCRP